MGFPVDAPLDYDKQSVKDFLAGIQGNILVSHKRGHARYYFFGFGRPRDRSELKALRAKAKAWMGAILRGGWVTNCFRQLEDDPDQAERFGQLLFTSVGYEFLGKARPKGGAFRDGMRRRGNQLNDPEFQDWDEGYRVPDGELHGMFLLAHKDEGPLKAAGADFEALAEQHGVVIHHVEEGRGIKNAAGQDIEHFGYADGISQPLFFQSDRPSDNFDQQEPLKRVLVEDRHAPGTYGSFMVFRKLEQNVKSWNQAVVSASEATGIDASLLGAMVVGRFKDGTPLAVAGSPQGAKPPKDASHDFNFEDDKAGNKTPKVSHIRKTNPRGDQGFLRDLFSSERGRRIVRRGITYGRREAGSVPTGGVGLLFMCFQADIADQFEFIQRRWANSPSFRSDVGRDGVIGQRGDDSDPGISLPTAHGSSGRVRVGFGEHVRMLGGEYLYAPSIEGLWVLSGEDRS